jgi:hypothetical protein
MQLGIVVRRLFEIVTIRNGNDNAKCHSEFFDGERHMDALYAVLDENGWYYQNSVLSMSTLTALYWSIPPRKN